MYVCNDGELVATLDENDESTVAFCSRQGTLAQIPRKEIIPDLNRAQITQIIENNGRVLSPKQVLSDLMENHIALFYFDPHTSQWVFSLWLGKKTDWISWSPSQRKMVQADEEQIWQLTQEAHKLALHELTNNIDSPRYFKFIATLRAEPDRALLEKLIRDRTFDFDEMSFIASNNDNAKEYPRALGRVFKIILASQ
jgi:hypothetical protein